MHRIVRPVTEFIMDRILEIKNDKDRPYYIRANSTLLQDTDCTLGKNCNRSWVIALGMKMALLG